MNDEQGAERIAGIAAVLSGACWVMWAVGNTLSHGGLADGSGVFAGPRLAKVGPLLTAGWNLLLVPAALALWRRLHLSRPDLVLLYTVAGILSLTFWAFGGVTRITPTLEITYLALAAVWWIGIGSSLRTHGRRSLGTFTMIVGCFAALDALLCFCEPVPFALFVLAAPKLPLAATWSIVIGIVLCRGD